MFRCFQTESRPRSIPLQNQPNTNVPKLLNLNHNGTWERIEGAIRKIVPPEGVMMAGAQNGQLQSRLHGFDPDKRPWRGDWYPVFI